MISGHGHLRHLASHFNKISEHLGQLFISVSVSIFNLMAFHFSPQQYKKIALTGHNIASEVCSLLVQCAAYVQTILKKGTKHKYFCIHTAYFSL